MSATAFPTAGSIEQTNVIAFPIQCSCPACGRVCSEDDLNECNRCEEKFCARTGCSMSCRCTRFVKDFVIPEMQRLQPSLWRRVLDYVRHV